jgi:hypothetical protein
VVSSCGVGHVGLGQRCRSEGHYSREHDGSRAADSLGEYDGSCAANSLGEYDGSCAADTLGQHNGPGATHTLELIPGNPR